MLGSKQISPTWYLPDVLGLKMPEYTARVKVVFPTHLPDKNWGNLIAKVVQLIPKSNVL